MCYPKGTIILVTFSVSITACCGNREINKGIEKEVIADDGSGVA